MRSPSIAIALFVLLAFGAIAHSAHAQDKDGEAKRENVNIEGKLEDAGGGLLKIKDAAGETYLVKPEGNAANFSVSGKAEASFLARGMVVRFEARFDKRGEAAEPLREIAIITPREGEGPGVFDDRPTSTISSDIFADPPEANAKPKKPAAPVAPSYRVIGLVTAMKNGKLQVAAGNVAVKAKLAPDARISVSVADLTFARPGDSVRVEGWRYPENKTQIAGTRVSITAAEPFTSSKSKPRPKPVAGKKSDKQPATEAAK